MRFECKHCGQHFEADEEMIGQSMQCQTCGKTFTVEAPVEEAPAAESTPDPDTGSDATPEGAAAEQESSAPAAPSRPETPHESYKLVQQSDWSGEDMDRIHHLREAHDKIIEQIRKAVVGQDKVVRLTMIGLFGQGHCLLMGVPGIGKTLLVRTLAQSLSLTFRRVQFTPDLMPSDITGTEVIEEDKASGERNFRFLEGPIFTNMLLADEINRTPPKTQAALLEAMQEHQVTVGGERKALEEPFFVLATQNPIEQEGTYPLPEAQMDRFMFQINVGYPLEHEEKKILDITTSGYEAQVESVLQREEIIYLQQLVRKVRISDDVVDHILKLVRLTRSDQPDCAEFVRKWVSWGAGPRASQYLVIGGKAVAILDGRNEVRLEDVNEVAHAVLCHRIQPNFAAEAEGINSTRIVDELLKEVMES